MTAKKTKSSDATPAFSPEDISEDDWAAAMAEQTACEEQAAQASHAADFFQQLPSPNLKGGNMMNELDMILDIPVLLSVKLGETKITINELLQLTHGSIIELSAMAGEPLDILVNNALVARGEVVVVNDKYGVRLTDIISREDRLKYLAKRS